MHILSHRGMWCEPCQKNTQKSFLKSFLSGFGTETDFRDYNGELVVSHDVPLCRPELTGHDFFAIDETIGRKLPLAINVKSDGLQKILKEIIIVNKLTNYFVFDMSIPDAVQFVKADIPIFTRQSDFEPEPYLYSDAVGVWIDAFKDDSWITAEIVSRHLHAKKRVCIVSPELHGREPSRLWERLCLNSFVENPNFMICTDLPLHACKFFNYDQKS